MRHDTRDQQTIGVQAIYSNGKLIYKDQQYEAETEVHPGKERHKTTVSNDRRI